MKKCIVPISGGIDSAVVLHKAAIEYKYDQILCIFYNYSQSHKTKEQTCALLQVDSLIDRGYDIFYKEITFPDMVFNSSALTNPKIPIAKTKDVLGDPQTVNYVPFRNQIFLSIACGYAEDFKADTVFHGAALVDDQAGYWDGTRNFVEKFNDLIALNRKNKIKAIAPLINMEKVEIIKNGLDLGVDFKNTWTCYEGKELACGHCTSCSSRIKGFLDLGVKDPVEYSRKDIPWSV